MADTAELLERYEATLDYAESGDVAKAEAHLRTLKSLQIMRPTSLRKGAASQLDYDHTGIQKQIVSCEQWLARVGYGKNSPQFSYYDIREVHP